MLNLVGLSDTHTYHNEVEVPECTLLVHTGDSTHRGYKSEFTTFLKWFSSLSQAEYKIFIAGNHDLCFDSKFDLETKAPKWLNELLNEYQVKRYDPVTGQWLFPDSKLIYLENTSVTINGYKIYGSPYTPWFYGDHWAFNKHRGEEIRKEWKKIPEDVDVLLTHGPLAGIVDACDDGKEAGCVDLKDLVEIIQPEIHLCGHIHEGYGIEVLGSILCANVSICNSKYRPVNTPMRFTLGAK